MTEPSKTEPNTQNTDDYERLRRWRLALGKAADEGLGGLAGKDDRAMDGALAALYDSDSESSASDSKRKAGGLGSSAPRVSRWLGDIRTYFPNSVVQVMQKDAIERLNLTQLLLEPELLEAVEPDVHLVGTLLSLNRVMPETTKATARMVVEKVVRDIERRIASKTTAAVTGVINRATRTSRPKLRDVDWDRTIRKNLGHYLPEHKTVVPERLVGYGRRAQAVHRDVVLAIDQSGSMASSVVYASVFGAVLASMRSLKTSLVVFDTAVVDLTDKLEDPVDVLFGTQLGGGTDINRAIAYCQSLITRPTESLFVLISDLYEGGVREQMLRRIGSMKESGVQVVVLLALSDDGAPSFDHDNASALAALGIPAFACTPDQFPELLAVALDRGDLIRWANAQQR
ncbi:VWA domain-containing protein [Antrihabitans sp. YC3-6]|uniref:VWA domain-containing protein n=1 Tax=Antrihabitans stalagmiti TaxID=2799499 RepID=A0A934NTI6_9NOCA|nr:VWA domain-containing protein [Antrihabitans stalagmiti]MBJ8341022.1 VWA domain-containing protein [Antrihabitans stalagmiti]